jgi:hypothetical protein
MALTTVDDVIAEIGASYIDYGFANLSTFQTWVQGLLNWMSEKVEGLVGTANYVATNMGVVQGELLWTCYYVLRRRRSKEAALGEGGFAIGSLRIQSSASSASGLQEERTRLWREGEVALRPYMTVTYSRALFHEYEDEETWADLEGRFYDRVFLRYE